MAILRQGSRTVNPSSPTKRVRVDLQVHPSTAPWFVFIVNKAAYFALEQATSGESRQFVVRQCGRDIYHTILLSDQDGCSCDCARFQSTLACPHLVGLMELIRTHRLRFDGALLVQ